MKLAARPIRVSAPTPIFFSVLVIVCGARTAGAADPAPQAEGPLVRLLKSGRLPEERLGTVVEMVGKRGGAGDLAYVYERVLRPDGFSDATRLRALHALADAASTRHVRPAGKLAEVGRLFRTGDEASRLAAIRLAGLWKVEALGGELRAIALAPSASDRLREAALDALAAIGGPAGRAGIEGMATAEQPVGVRLLAVAALARLDLDAAADRAVAALRAGSRGNDLAPLLAAFLNRQGGAAKLAAAVARGGLPADEAKLALRSMYAIGRSDPELAATLSRAAGLGAEAQALDKPQLDRLVADVQGQGDPERGEAVFRRKDLNCTKCHAIGGAGGGVGPDLSAVGASSPPDYLVNSILLPDQSIKEPFHTKIVLTGDGQVLHGIVADRDGERLVLKEATGAERVVPVKDIEEEKEGGSLMPKGLVSFMTRAELVDLVRFLSELGKPGPYAIRSTPTVQRWRVLKDVPEDLARATPDPATFRAQILGADESRWLPAYAKVGGLLPLDELTAETGAKVLYLQGEVEVTVGGALGCHINMARGLAVWVDGQPAPALAQGSFVTELPRGRHKLTFRIDASQADTRQLKVEPFKPAGSTAEFTVVGGP